MKIVVFTGNCDAHNFRVQLGGFLIDGMDIDEEWCDNYLDGKSEEVENGARFKMRTGFFKKFYYLHVVVSCTCSLTHTYLPVASFS